MIDAQWKLIDGGGGETGPYSTADLQAFYHSGHINEDSLIWTDGLTDWVKASEVEGLLPNIQQVVELPGAQPIEQAAPVAHAGGLNVAPTLPSLGEGKAKAAGWLGGMNFLTCLLALLLFFLPWVELSCTEDAASPLAAMAGSMGIEETQQTGKEVKKTKKRAKQSSKEADAIPKLPSPLVVQSGFQAIIGGLSPSSEMKEMEAAETAKQEKAGKTVDTSGGLFGEEFTQDAKEEERGAAIWVALAFGLVIIALVLSIFVFVNLNRGLLLACQICCLVAAACIGIQMSAGFPAAGGGVAADEEAAMAQAMFKQFFVVEYTIWLYLELIILGSALLFLIIGRTSAGTRKANPLTLPQPGGGLKLH